MSCKKAVECINKKKCGWKSPPKAQYELNNILKCPRCGRPVKVNKSHLLNKGCSRPWKNKNLGFSTNERTFKRHKRHTHQLIRR